MRVDVQGHLIDKINMKKPQNEILVTDEKEYKNNKNEQDFSKEKLQQAVDSINEFFEVTHSELKFVFHEGLEKYFVQLVNSDTEEVVKEIPSKKLLDVFYEMQKLIGIIVDEKI
ncbi:flagellar protein FlaG [Ureibacillus chungkukjangi]|uniref:flagellar protein FlaG n=1 Tax=Ureibacillus chungkukjangi TaxID=1202712 RepID=UPI00384AAA48